MKFLKEKVYLQGNGKKSVFEQNESHDEKGADGDTPAERKQGKILDKFE